MPEILHITPRDKWEQAVAEGEYRSDDLATEGFIHCLTPEQLPYVYGPINPDAVVEVVPLEQVLGGSGYV